MRPSPIAGLTRRRQEVFRGILRFLATEGRYPTGVELAHALGRTPDATWAMLRALTREGLVERREGQYVLTPAGLEVAAALGTTVWRGDEEVQTALKLLGVSHAAIEDGR
ncbi:LexA family protein [Thermus thermophilus]|uniref:LexA family protein n=1 Tax=Thermus thermophilus TaxID=274 RepID=UPI00216B6657|nr:hypothetical protein [Thermus thermophilus]